MKSFLKVATRFSAVAGCAIASVLAAQTVPDDQVPADTGLNLPQNLQIFGKADPNIRKPTAIVNNAVITGTDVDQRMAMTLSLSEAQSGNKITLSDADREQLRLQMLRAIVDDTLQIQEAKAHDITVTPEELNSSYANVSRRFGRTPAQMSEYLRSIGSSDRALKRQLEGELAWSRLLRRRVAPFVNVGEEEVKATIDRLKAAQGTEEYHLREIYMSATPERQGEVLANMRKMIEQMRGGAPFEYFARNFSEASTKAVGGDLGWVRLSMLPDALQQASRGISIGQIAGPIEVPGGYSILFLVDKRQVLTADPRDARLALRQLTIKFPQGTTQAQASARAAEFGKAVQQINGCGSVGKVATQIGAEVVDNDTVRIRDLPPQLADIVLKMQIGQATPPFGSPEDGVRALVLCGRDDPQAALPNAEQVQAQMEEQRVNLRAQRMLRDLRRDAIIEYR